MKTNSHQNIKEIIKSIIQSNDSADIESICAKIAQEINPFGSLIGNIYETVFENTGTAMCIIKNDGTIEIANTKFSELAELPLHEINSKKKWMEFVHKEDLEMMLNQHKARRNNQNEVLKEYDFRFISAKGEKKYIHLIVDIIAGTKLSVTSLIDITERKINEINLKKSRKSFKDIFENAGDGILIGNLKGEIIKVNTKACKLTAYSSEELIGKNIKMLFSNDSLKKTPLNYKDLLSGKTKTNERKLITKSGKTIWIEMISKKISEGTLQALFRDISARKKAEKKLKESEEKYRLLVENQSDMIVKVDKSNKFTFVSNSYCKTFGKSEKELLGKSFMPLVHPDDINSTEKAMKQLFNPPYEVEIEQRAFTVNGWRWLHWKDKAILNKNNEIKEIIGVGTDITERKIAEQKLKLFEKAVDQNPVSIVITNSNGDIEYVNPVFSEITGYSQSEVIGKNPRILKTEYYDNDFYKKLWQTITSGENWTGEFRNKKKNGEIYWEDVIISPIVDDKGNITHFISVKEDISEKKQFIKELQLAKEKAEENDKLKSAFLANMSHEIRTPMNGIIGFMELLKNKNLSQEKRDKFIELINNSGKRLLDTINNIIEIAKIEAKQVKLEKNDFSISDILKYFDEFYTPLCNKKNIKFEVNNKLNNKYLIINSDSFKIESILSNFINNAIKFTEFGKISLNVQGNDKYIHFDVSDTGKGIEESKQEKIFEQFVQAETKITRNHEGSGLGLAICKAYADLLNAEIGLDSTLGKGSRFSLKINL